MGFKTGLSDEDMIGNTSKKKYGYFLAFKEDVQDLNFKNEKAQAITGADAAIIGNALIDNPTVFGKHLSLFV